MSNDFDIFEKLRNLSWQDALLLEGVRADTIRKAYADKIPAEQLKWLEDADPTDGKKYFAWMAKQYLMDPENILVIGQYVERFEQDKLHKIIKGEQADINKYADVLALRADIIDAEKAHKVEQEKLSKEKAVTREVRLEAGQQEALKNGGAKKVFDGPEAMVFFIDSLEAAEAFQNTPESSSGLTWCFTRKEEVHWNDYYYEEQSAIYIVWDKRNENPIQAAVLVEPSGGVQYGDVNNTQLDEYDVKEMAEELGIPLQTFAPLSEDEANERSEGSLEAQTDAAMEAVSDGVYRAWEEILKPEWFAKLFYKDPVSSYDSHRSVEQPPEDVTDEIFSFVINKIKEITGGIPKDIDEWSWDEVSNAYAYEAVEKFLEVFMKALYENI